MKTVNIKAPVLFMVFNRPEKTQRVFDVIKLVQPTKLYIAADAPRNNVFSDQENCSKVRDIVLQVDWECDVKYLFHETNLGCSLAGKTAWDWIFSQEEEMIFLEDDGLVSVSFFSYCQELLSKYRYDQRIAYIGGVNYGIQYSNYSYFFSKMPSATYSMATWKRVYDLYEYRLESYKENRNNKKFRQSFFNYFLYQFFRKRFDRYLVKPNQTYDLQMIYLVHKYDLYSIYPNTNLSSNIGLDFGGANNSIDPQSNFAQRYGNRPRFELDEIIHPEKFEFSRHFESKHIRIRVFYGKSWISAMHTFYFYPFYSAVYQGIKKSVHRITK